MPKPLDYKDAFLHCRTFGHTWRVGHAESRTRGSVALILICDYCTTRRSDLLSTRTGALIEGHRRYEYPDGYQCEPGEGLMRADYRIEFLRRLPIART